MKNGDPKSIHAIYENGVFRPLGQVELPDHTEVEFVPYPVRHDPKKSHQDTVYKILSRAYDTDDPHLSERHNDHRP
jgi:predicted DNA-binding antitoxin AbrB/MazE fold protein